MKRWSTTWTVDSEELGTLRNMFGEKVNGIPTSSPSLFIDALLDCLLFRISAIVLFFSADCCMRGCSIIRHTTSILARFCDNELSLVCCFRRVLETSRD